MRSQVTASINWIQRFARKFRNEILEWNITYKQVRKLTIQMSFLPPVVLILEDVRLRTMSPASGMNEQNVLTLMGPTNPPAEVILHFVAEEYL